ncbi:MAG: PEGA domain-containing protein [Acidobacteria bacterium]|nr:PEGA domain-containing protein [Acidobacteriota bacterium]
MREFLAKTAVLAGCYIFVVGASAQTAQTLGEIRFHGGTSQDRDSGVWVDEKYLGSLKELHGRRKVLLPPGEHEISVRQFGCQDLTTAVVVEANQIQTIQVNMLPTPPTTPVLVTSSLNFRVHPGRAAVMIDDKYLGRASEFGGTMHSLPLNSGIHRIRIQLPGYRTFEAEVSLAAGQSSQVKAQLLKVAADAVR